MSESRELYELYRLMCELSKDYEPEEARIESDTDNRGRIVLEYNLEPDRPEEGESG